MFFRLILENANGDRVDMTTTANQYMTAKVEGLNPPPGTISTSSYAGMDGSYLNNAFIEKRNVVIHFEMRGVGLEARRHSFACSLDPALKTLPSLRRSTVVSPDDMTYSTFSRLKVYIEERINAG